MSMFVLQSIYNNETREADMKCCARQSTVTSTHKIDQSKPNTIFSDLQRSSSDYKNTTIEHFFHSTCDCSSTHLFLHLFNYRCCHRIKCCCIISFGVCSAASLWMHIVHNGTCALYSYMISGVTAAHASRPTSSSVLRHLAR